MTLQENPLREGLRVETRRVDYLDRDEMDRLIGQGWTYIGAGQWAAPPLPTPEYESTSPGLFLPRLPSDCLPGDGLVLTYPKITDASTLCANELDEVVRQHAIFPPSSPRAIEALIVDAFPGSRVGDSTVLIAREDIDGPPLAKVSVRRLVPPGVLDVGYATMPGQRGKGYAARALVLFTSWAFTLVNVQRIELGIKPGNVASTATALKAGYRLESVRRSRLKNADGSFDDEHSYVAISTDRNRAWRCFS